MAVATADLPTVYQYYTGNGITKGLSDNQPYFTLNNKNITIYSGAFHYFRVPRAYWRDRLRKMRAAGLNTVETYVPWNLHEPHSGVYDFGQGGSDMEDFLHMEEFFKIAKEEDLLALVRPGPYICSEWEFGGLPSWLLRNTSTVRTSKDTNYMAFVKRYFGMLLPLLAALQFQKGGPIIAFQIENEYGNTRNHDLPYLQAIKQMYLDHGLVELLYTADPPSANGLGAIPGILQTANFDKNPKGQLDKLNTLQKNKPTMTMEYWTGWFDYWTGGHNTVSPSLFTERLKIILEYPSSVNMYMFVGSTNFGFLNGASQAFGAGTNNSEYNPIVTSYDYDSPLTEYGTYTAKYNATKQLIASHSKLKFREVALPKEGSQTAYPELKPEGQMLLSEYIDNIREEYESKEIGPMELFPVNNHSGQSFGSIVYRKEFLDIPANGVLKISGYVRDTVLVLIDGVLVSKAPKQKADLNGFGFWKQYNSTLVLTSKALKNVTLQLVVENNGRNNYGALQDFRQFKGLTAPIFLNNIQLKDFFVKHLEFKKSVNLKMTEWKWNPVNDKNVPSLYKFSLNITGQPEDTFVNMSGWNKGLTIVNGFVLGRHFFLASTQTLYLPAPLLKSGHNDIIVFEHYNSPGTLKFSNKPVLH